MTLKTRKILYITFILLFITITPMVSLYAAGYKFSGDLKIQKTGILIIDSNPKGAQILINGEIQQDFLKRILSSDKGYIKTPAKIKNLVPGEYDIEVKMNNYLPWSKKLIIKSGQSTFAEDINLFKNNLPTLIFNKNDTKNIVSPNNKKFLTQKKDDQLVILDIESEKENILKTEIKNFDESNTKWSQNNKKIIINNEIFNLDTPDNPIYLNKIIGNNISDIKWNTSNDYIILYKNSSNLSYYNLNNQTNKLILKNYSLKDFIAKDNLLYFIEEQKNNSLLITYNINESRKINEISLPRSEYLFINENHRLINLYDSVHKILYLIDPYDSFKPIRETINNVTKTNWVNENKLLYTGDFEIWILDLNNLTKKILTRVSQKINTLIWHPSNNNIIFATEKNINVLELDNREKYNITKIIELDNISDTILNEKGDTLYFHAQIGNQEGMYKLLIQ